MVRFACEEIGLDGWVEDGLSGVKLKARRSESTQRPSRNCESSSGPGSYGEGDLLVPPFNDLILLGMSEWRNLVSAGFPHARPPAAAAAHVYVTQAGVNPVAS